MRVFEKRHLVLGFVILIMLITVGCEQPAVNTGDSSSTSAVVSDGSSVEVGVSSGDSLARFGAPVVQGSSVSRGIVVSGQGSTKITPDIAVFSTGVITTGGTSNEAISRNADVMTEVLKALNQLGVADDDIETQNINVWPEFDYGNRDEGRELPLIIGYRAENRVLVTVRDIGSVGDIIDAAASAGANQIYGLSFTVSDDTRKSLRGEVLELAVEDATEKAQSIANALDIPKIIPVSVVESGGFAPPIYRYDVAVMEKGASTPVSPGEVEVSASVTVTFDWE